MIRPNTSVVYDPRTGEAYAEVRIDGAERVAEVLAAADSAFTEWGRSTPAVRQSRLAALAAGIEARAPEIAVAEARNTGKSVKQVLYDELPSSIDEIRFMAGALRVTQGQTSGVYAEGYSSHLAREPVGVCVLIIPWNYPFPQAISKIAPALAMGNAVVVKPAETTPMSSQLLQEICEDVLPKNMVQFVYGDRDTGRALVDSSIPALVSLTGSTTGGMEVARAAARTLKRVELELGGNCAALVFEDADVSATVEGLVEAAFYSAGQDCTAACRILVHAEIAHDFTQEFQRAVRQVSVDPLNSRGQLDRVAGYLDRLPASARIVAGGHRRPGQGFFFEPTVVTHVEQGDEIVQDEVFGPVVTIQTFETIEEAISKANDVSFGLAASVWTKDYGRAVDVPTRLDVGTAWVNCHGVWASEMPHGGFKASGYGKELSAEALLAYGRTKHTLGKVGLSR